jgi:hypothetical protein
VLFEGSAERELQRNKVDFFEILATAVPSKENIHDKMKIRVATSWEVQ